MDARAEKEADRAGIGAEEGVRQVGIREHRHESEESDVGDRVGHLALLRFDDGTDREGRRDAADRGGCRGEGPQPVGNAEQAGERCRRDERDGDDDRDHRDPPGPQLDYVEERKPDAHEDDAEAQHPLDRKGEARPEDAGGADRVCDEKPEEDGDRDARDGACATRRVHALEPKQTRAQPPGELAGEKHDADREGEAGEDLDGLRQGRAHWRGSISDDSRVSTRGEKGPGSCLPGACLVANFPAWTALRW